MFLYMPNYISTLYENEIYTIQVNDNSMSPKINHNDIVFCDPNSSIKNGNIVHYWLDGISGIRKYQISSCGEISLVPVNSSYESISIDCEKKLKIVKIVGKIDNEF